MNIQHLLISSLFCDSDVSGQRCPESDENVSLTDIRTCPEYLAGMPDSFNNQALRDFRENGADSSEQHAVIFLVLESVRQG
jgi:rhodanese-related sulfurtransferase